MGVYRERVLPRIHNRVLASAEIDEIRARVCAPLHGTVVEIGFGSGLNIPHYPATVSQVLAIEPSALAKRLAEPRVRAAGVPIEFVGDDGQLLPLPDGSVDTALITFSLCSIPDQPAAARELHRVLRPGGFICYVEHGLHPDPTVARWQRRLNPVNRRVSGCWLDTGTDPVLRDAGLTPQEREYDVRRAARVSGHLHEGIARKSA